MPDRFHKKKPGKVFDKEKTSVSDTGRTRNSICRRKAGLLDTFL